MLHLSLLLLPRLCCLINNFFAFTPFFALSPTRYFDQVIEERLAERKTVQTHSTSDGPKKRLLAFLDLLIDAYEDGKISKEGVKEEVDTFMFEAGLLINVLFVCLFVCLFVYLFVCYCCLPTYF